jgi:RHS repeat-associated protein
MLTDDAPATGVGPQGDYAYDANGNRTAAPGSTYTISTTSNRLLSVSGAINRTYSYDAAGNTTGYTGLTFTYNDAGRMVGVSGGASASYSHNALGQRVKKTVSGVATYFVYDEAGHLIGEYDGSGNLIQETVWLGDIPVATLRPNGGSVSIYYVHADHLGTPRRITRPSDSAIVWRWDSDPFGTDAPDQDPDGDSTQFAYNLRFPGQYFDAESGLSYNYFRDYDAVVGRYAQSDPIGLRGGLNTYGYAKANPIRWIDPLGLDECEVYEKAANEAEEKRKQAEDDEIMANVYGDEGAREDAEKRINEQVEKYDKAMWRYWQCCARGRGNDEGEDDSKPDRPRVPPTPPVDVPMPNIKIEIIED